MTIRNWPAIPLGLRGVSFVHPSAYPWFVVAALVLGIPATLSRPLGSWIALGAGIVVVLLGAFGAWLLVRTRTQSRRLSGCVIVAHAFVIAAASVIVEVLNPISSYSTTVNDTPPGPSFAALAFLTACLTIVWTMLWGLTAILLAAQLSYRRTRRALLTTLSAVELAGKQFSLTVVEPTAALQKSVALDLNTRLQEIESVVEDKRPQSRKILRERFDLMMTEVVLPALKALRDIKLDESITADAVEEATRNNKKRVREQNGSSRTPLRWNGVYFSGLIGALVIGIVAISGSASINFTSPGFLVQIPLIVIAFYVSVPAALLLFFAAALTPFLGPNSGAPENFALFIVILLLALLSFVHRANEVRQLRVLETLSITNSNLSRQLVDFRQRTSILNKQMNSVLHGKVQAVLVAAQVALAGKTPSFANHVDRIISTLRDAVSDLVNDEPAAEVDFARSIAEVVALWDGSLDVTVNVSPAAQSILTRDAQATAIVTQVISEGALNAAKHATTSSVEANVSADGQRVRVRVTNASSPDTPVAPTSSHIGLNYLKQLTNDLRLEVGPVTTVLSAEVTSRVTVPERYATVD